jgi:uncharacterized phage-associated protein
MSYSSKAIANYFLDAGRQDGKSISPLKMQKLAYFAHGWYLALQNEPLLDERVEAWRYGPVVPSLYHEFKSYGRGAISEYATELDVSSNFDWITPKVPDEPRLKEFLDKVWEVYSPFSAIQLSNATHRPGTPWCQTWGNNGATMGTDISDELIKTYFKKLASDNKNEK